MPDKSWAITVKNGDLKVLLKGLNGTVEGTRTRTDMLLRHMPLPIGLLRHSILEVVLRVATELHELYYGVVSPNVPLMAYLLS